MLQALREDEEANLLPSVPQVAGMPLAAALETLRLAALSQDGETVAAACCLRLCVLVQRTGLDDPYQGQASDIGLMVRENLRDNERTERALSEITGRAPLTVQEEMPRDFYLSSSEAVQYGLIDRVLLPTADDKVRYQSTSDGLAVAGRG